MRCALANSAIRRRPCCSSAMSNEDFYVRYYVGHKGKFGHEFLEFEFRPDGKVRAHVQSAMLT